ALFLPGKDTKRDEAGQNADGGGGERKRPGVEPPRVEVGTRKKEATPFTGEVFNPAAMVSRPPRIDGLRAWNIESDRHVELAAIHFTPDGKPLVLTRSASGGLTRWWWSVADGGLDPVPLEGYDDLTEDGSRAVRGWGLWHPGAAAPYRVLRGALGIFQDARFSPDGKFVATTTNEYHLDLWRVEDGDHVRLANDMTGSGAVRWSPDGRHLAAFNHPSFQLVFDAGTGKVVRRLNAGEGMGSFRGGPQFTPDGQALLTLHDNGVLQLWGRRTGLARATVPDAAPAAPA